MRSIRTLVLYISVMLTVIGCVGTGAGTAQIRSSNFSQGGITPNQKLLVITNLGHHIGGEAFTYISTKLPNMLRDYGVEAKVIPTISPNDLDGPEIVENTKGFGARYVLILARLARASDVMDRSGRLRSLDVLANLVDTTSNRKIWGGVIYHGRGSITVDEGQRTDPLVDTLVGELKKTGLLGNAKSAPSINATAPPALRIPKSGEPAESRLRQLDELLKKSLISQDEYKAKRTLILDDL